MDTQQFETLLRTMMVDPSIEAATRNDEGGFNVDAWINGFAQEAAIHSDRFGKLPKSMRMDTATGLFQQQLQHVMAQTYDRPYPGLMARTWMPAASGIPAGAETVVQRGFDISGAAELVVNDGRDIPRVSMQATESVSRVVGLACKWRLNYSELLNAAMSGVDLDGKGLAASMAIQQREIDSLLSVGNAQYLLFGLLNYGTKVPAAAGAGVQLFSVGVPVGFTAAWDAAATAAQILADWALLETNWRNDNVHVPNTCLLGSGTYARLNTLTVVAGTTDTVLDVLKRRYPGISFEAAWRCDTAGAAGGERVCLFERGPDVCESIVSMEPTNLPPVWDGFGWETVTYSRCGGTQAADTLGILYADM